MAPFLSDSIQGNIIPLYKNKVVKRIQLIIALYYIIEMCGQNVHLNTVPKAKHILEENKILNETQ